MNRHSTTEPINARLLAAAKRALPFVFRELNNAQDDMPTYTALETAIAEAEAQPAPKPMNYYDARCLADDEAAMRRATKAQLEEARQVLFSLQRPTRQDDQRRLLRLRHFADLAQPASDRPSYDELLDALSDSVSQVEEDEDWSDDPAGSSNFSQNIRALLKRAGR